ncbi:X-Pro aminopeptidase [Microbotryum lychnidis-dioicae p1A1 Lamole]|uniref:X-Pro aminopeptidase n=1 Tax=Microbotryum lychnidis-dioicae (strain p1A1 Lamole / MvSl-1064) TaxID=683840 RepID=U5H2J8_USTV1|nr:X-Pro aminopeptidase [Microbotryum lychnidis-dioicae p1A1 Lamole]|eukprot:KDE08101.1 X-Pro aminopeptidase [Microbotryum lychnidis-dioicae p1A1 Lamole]
MANLLGTAGKDNMVSLERGRLTELRKLMKEHNVDGYIVDSGDAHGSEYIAACDERRAWISGFTGSAGTAVVFTNEARLTTDGRYHQQAGNELSSEWTLYKHGIPEVKSWQEQLAALPPSTRIGLDPTLISVGDYHTILPTLSSESKLVPIENNLVDAIWADRPARPKNPVVLQEIKYAGQASTDKMEAIRKEVTKKDDASTSVPKAKTTYLVSSMLDEICWTLNLRGSDIAFNPVFFAHLVIPIDARKKPTLFVDLEQLPQSVYEYLDQEVKVDIEPYEDVYKFLKTVGQGLGEHEKVMMPKSTNLALALAVGLDKCDAGSRGPIVDLKAVKNDVEIEGFRQSHLRDGVALVRYFAWLEQQLDADVNVSEYEGAQQLEKFRKELDLFKGLSFTTISSTGANASIIHYHYSEDPAQATRIRKDQIYLCDSGAQFNDGTTDTTRTLHFGEPSMSERRAYTRVLQGHIAIDTAVFPETTTGYLLDAFARRPLWLDGLDYRHGTGHGVGSHINVHEGPQGIGTRIAYNEVKLRAGHVCSNEPGYYEDGKFGIRIENIVVVREASTLNQFGGVKFLEMESVTQVPIATNLVLVELLSPDERDWLNTYNASVREKLTPLIKKTGDESALKWLEKETRAL